MDMENILNNLPVLETGRLILRKISVNDAENIFEYAKDDEVTKNLVWATHKTIEDTKKFLAEGVGFMPPPWAIVCKTDNKVIGTISFMNYTPEHSRVEVGFVISKKYWGRGFMTEVLKEVIKFGFEKLKINRIEAFCNSENAASAKVMEKSGMKLEGMSREYLFVKGKFWDMKIYSILKNDLMKL